MINKYTIKKTPDRNKGPEFFEYLLILLSYG